MSESPRAAVLLDRDGVLNVYLPGDYVKTPAEFRLISGAGAAVARLNAAGYPVYVISNQQGVAKGLMTPADLDTVDRTLHDLVAAEGGRIERSYYCPHAAADRCGCRKPEAGLILKAAKENGIDLARSVFVGDTETDSRAARTAGVGQFVLVLTGKHRSAEIAADRERFPVPPDHIASDLAEAVDWILARPAE